jgi:hypothetical protein
MSMRVLADPVAVERVTHLRGVIDSGFIDTVQQLIGDGDVLADAAVWDGPRAAEFRGMWPELRQALLDSHTRLSELAANIGAITDAIMAAGGG